MTHRCELDFLRKPSSRPVFPVRCRMVRQLLLVRGSGVVPRSPLGAVSGSPTSNTRIQAHQLGPTSAIDSRCFRLYVSIASKLLPLRQSIVGENLRKRSLLSVRAPVPSCRRDLVRPAAGLRLPRRPAGTLPSTLTRPRQVALDRAAEAMPEVVGRGAPRPQAAWLAFSAMVRPGVR